MKPKISDYRWAMRVLTLIFATVCILWQPEGFASERTGFKVTVVAASNNGSGIDSKIKHLSTQLKQLGQYKRFRYISATGFTLPVGGSRSFTVVKRVQGTIKLKWIKNNRAAFQFRMTSGSGKPVDIHYSIARPGKTMVVGPNVGGERYVIVIQALK